MTSITEDLDGSQGASLLCDWMRLDLEFQALKRKRKILEDAMRGAADTLEHVRSLYGPAAGAASQVLDPFSIPKLQTARLAADDVASAVLIYKLYHHETSEAFRTINVLDVVLKAALRSVDIAPGIIYGLATTLRKFIDQVLSRTTH